MLYVYRIHNTIDDYSYVGCTTQDIVTNRLYDHLKKGYLNAFSRKDDYLKTEYQKSNWRETIYGKGPMYTKRNKLESALKLYGYHNFYVELICQVRSGKYKYDPIENYFIYKFSDKTYNCLYSPVKETEVDKSTIVMHYKNFRFPFGHRNIEENLTLESRWKLLRNFYQHLVF